MAEAEGRRIALIGAINRDTIRTADGVETESYGGLLYSILSLAAIVDDQTAVNPVVNVGEDMRGVVEKILTPVARVSLDGVDFVPEKNTHCYLDYDEVGNKQESLLGVVPKLTRERLEPYLDCDAICVNFITGEELELETLRAVRKASQATVFMDVHSLSLGTDDQQRRYLRVPPNWEAWTACADVIQMNELEAGLLAGHSIANEEATLAFGRRLLENGSKIAIITRGEAGADVVFGTEDEPRFHHSPSQPTGPVQDETGCGDVFLMGFAWAYLQDGDPIEASRYANVLAGINVTLRGIDGVRGIGETLSARDAS
jgi:sugar/nucleoside kinase (ribokinase family)